MKYVLLSSLFVISMIQGCEMPVISRQSAKGAAAAKPVEVPYSLPSRLYLYFDINKNILMEDAVQGKTVEETSNAVLAEFTPAAWDGGHVETYYSYVTRQISGQYPSWQRSSEQFKKERETRLKHFPIALQQFPDLLKNYKKEQQALAEVLKNNPAIFPSFFTALEELDKILPKRYAIILYTMGEDIPKIVPIIEAKTTVRFAALGQFKDTDLYIHGKKTPPHEFFKNPALQHYAIRSDYHHWKKHGFQAEGGKLFLLEEHDPEADYIFFDDNADDPDKPIIQPRSFNGELKNTRALMESGHIVATNPKEAALNKNFFIEKIMRRLQNRAQYMASRDIAQK